VKIFFPRKYGILQVVAGSVAGLSWASDIQSRDVIQNVGQQPVMMKKYLDRQNYVYKHHYRSQAIIK
jgi:hypothetical protein